jgi:methionyl aminopeptidase
MRAAGQLAARVLDMIHSYVVEGITTDQLNTLCHDFILANNAIPAPLNYKGFPKSVCISINHVICHGIPSNRKLLDGDTLNIDVTVILDGWHGDSSRMYSVGKPSTKARNLMDMTYEAMMLGIAQIKPGKTLGDIGFAIQSFAERHRYNVVRDFCGHGIGRVFHEPPAILRYGRKGHGIALHPGMLFTVEPMVNVGGCEVKMLADGWTAVTKDRSLSAQYEHTVGVTETGHEIFTLSPMGMHKTHERIA